MRPLWNKEGGEQSRTLAHPQAMPAEGHFTDVGCADTSAKVLVLTRDGAEWFSPRPTWGTAVS